MEKLKVKIATFGWPLVPVCRQAGKYRTTILGILKLLSDYEDKS